MVNLNDVLPVIPLLLATLSLSFVSTTTVSAFQSPSRLTDRSTTTIYRPKEEKCIINNNNNPREMETRIYSERRQFVRHGIRFATAGLLSRATVSWYDPATAEAKEVPDMALGGVKAPKGLGGLPKKIRLVGNILDELQRDLMQERWDLVEKYPEQLRSYVPIFTKYTDLAFPSNAETDKDQRVALRLEVGKFFSSLVRLRKATARRALDEAYVAYADMSVHFDRYLRVGGLYTYFDPTVSNEALFQGYSIVYANQKKDPPLVRDLVVLTKGPDMGKTGIVIGIYSDESKNCVIKLDRSMGLREIRVVPLKNVGKRLGEQDPDDVFLIPRDDADETPA